MNVKTWYGVINPANEKKNEIIVVEKAAAINELKNLVLPMKAAKA